jgi:hypothetical protein
MRFFFDGAGSLVAGVAVLNGNFELFASLG